MRRRSLERLAVLVTLGLAAEAADDGNSRFRFLNSQLGIAIHEAMVKACDDFERNALKKQPPRNSL